MNNKKYIIEKSILSGVVTVSGAKNSSLRLLAASLLTNEPIHLLGMPTKILDYTLHLELLEQYGKKITDFGDNTTLIEGYVVSNSIEWNKRSLRNTLLILGALLTRTGKGMVPLPGGCKLGERKFDIHEMIMRKLGANVWTDENYLYAEVLHDRLIGTDLYLPIRSTGATENGIIMGVLATGITRIWNPHIRPEIIDLITMLNKMGAKITVFGQESIEIIGVEELSGVHYTCIPDNVEALTFLVASAITGGEIEIDNFPFMHLEIPMIHLKESGLKYYLADDRKSIILKKSRVYPIDIATGPYPAINSDMQPLFAVYALASKGKSRIIDLRFPGRYQYASELQKLNAKLEINGDFLEIDGPQTLSGCIVNALDLRAGAALVLAGLIADDYTTVENAWQIDRGYENFLSKMKSLNANIREEPS